MKANEMPEKIYSIPTEGGFYLTAIKPEPPFTDGIEYTRTDAFIEKACEYLQKNLWRVVNEEPDFRQRFVTDFKNYMKGE